MSKYGQCGCGHRLHLYATRETPVIACRRCQITKMTIAQFRRDEAKAFFDEFGLSSDLMGKRPE